MKNYKTLTVTWLTLSLIGLFACRQAVAAVDVSNSIEISGENQNVIAADEQYRPQITPNNQFVVFAAKTGQSQDVHLFSTPIDGGSLVQLTPVTLTSVFDFIISPDSQWVVYRGDNGLNSVSITGGSSNRLDSELPISTSINSVKITPDSSHIVYVELGSLRSVKIDGTNSTLLNANQPSMAFDVTTFALSPDSSTVLFPLTESNNKVHLYSVPIGQSNLTDLIADTSNIESFLFSNVSNLTGYTSDGSRIIFSAYTVAGFYQALFSIPASGGVPVALSPAPTGDGGSRTFNLIDNDSKVVFAFADSFSTTNKIFVADIVTGAMTTLVNELSGVEYFEIVDNQTAIAFAVNQGMTGTQKFYRKSIDGSGNASSLFGGEVLGPATSGYRVTKDEKNLIWSHLISAGDQFRLDIKAIPLTGTRVTLLNSTTSDFANVSLPDFLIGEDSSNVVFLNKDADEQDYGPFAVSITGGAVTRVDSSNLLYEYYTISNDGKYIVYVAAERDTMAPYQLFSSTLTAVEDPSTDEACYTIKTNRESIAVICL